MGGKKGAGGGGEERIGKRIGKRGVEGTKGGQRGRGGGAKWRMGGKGDGGIGEGRQWRNEEVPLPPLYSGFTLCSNTIVEVYSCFNLPYTVCFQQNGMHQTENSNET